MKSNLLAISTALVCAAMMSSCNVNDEIGNNDPVAVRFTAGIDNQAIAGAPAGTRAAGTDWTAGDAIGIFMVDGVPDVVAGTANKQYKTETATLGTFEPESSADAIYYPMDGSTVNFIAYYPYKSGVALGTAIDVELATDQSVADVQPTFDLLYSKGASGSKTSGSVNLPFDHKLAKMVMNVTAHANVGVAITGMTVSINGMNTKNTFNLTDGTLGATPGTPAAITPRAITVGSAYDAIIMPDTYAADAVTVEFTINPDTAPETFKWTLKATDAVFVGGNEYTYAVTLSRTGVTATGTINPWITMGNNRGDVTAE